MTTIVPRRRFNLNRARTHAARRIILKRAASARAAAIEADDRDEALFAAALRGKARGLAEAAGILDALENDRRLPPRRKDCA